MSFTLIKLSEGRTHMGRPYVKIVAQDGEGNKVWVFACTPEKIAAAMNIPVDHPFEMTWQEQNGFRFLTSIHEVETGDTP